MKTLTYLTIALTLCGACRSTKEKERKHYQETLVRTDKEMHQSFYFWNNTDSTARSWKYRGDTIFYYHPDHGLWAGKGHLQVQEYRRVNNHGYGGQDSISLKGETVERSWTERTSRVSTRNWHWIILVICGFVFLMFILSRRKR